MASVIANAAPYNNAGVAPVIPRGRPLNIGTLAGTTSVLQFSVMQENASPNGLDCMTIVTVGGTLTAALEASIDGGVTWFGVPLRSPTFTVTTLNTDTAASSASSYDISSLQAGALFRFGSSAAVTGTPVVWILVS